MHRASILVEDGVIRQVGKINGPADKEIDGSGKIALPGLINAHTHLSMTLFAVTLTTCNSRIGYKKRSGHLKRNLPMKTAISAPSWERWR